MGIAGTQLASSSSFVRLPPLAVRCSDGDVVIGRYNSVIFASIGTNNYMVISINSAFLTAKSPSFESIIGRMPAADWNMTMDLRKAASNGSLERLDNLACIQAYAQDYVSGRSNVLLISTDHNATALPEYYFSDTIGNIAINRNTICAQDMFHWICPDLGSGCQDVCRSHLAQVSSDASQWRPHSQPADVAYCLSQPTPQHCKLQFSLPIVIVVLVMNVVKMLLMIYTIFGLDDTPLLTIGDAIASFLDRADPTTKYCCLMSKFEIKENPLYWHYLQVQSKYPPAKAWTASRVRWSRAVSRTRWWVCGSLSVFPLSHFHFIIHLLNSTLGFSSRSHSAQDFLHGALLLSGVPKTWRHYGRSASEPSLLERSSTGNLPVDQSTW